MENNDERRERAEKLGHDFTDYHARPIERCNFCGILLSEDRALEQCDISDKIKAAKSAGMGDPKVKMYGMPTFTTEDDFVDQINKIIAPVTRAWNRPEIVGQIREIVIRPQGADNPDRIDLTVTVRMRRVEAPEL